MESFFVRAIKSPIRLFIYVLVLYLASHSALVAFFVVIVVVSMVYHSVAGTASKATPAAPDVVVPRHKSSQASPPVDEDCSITPQYAKSAVITPFPRSGTSSRS